MLLVFPSQKDFVLVFRGAESPRAQKGSLPTIHPRISPKIPQSYPQIPDRNASCLSFSERFCFGFQRGGVPSGAEGFTPNDSPANFPEDPPILPTDSRSECFLSFLLRKILFWFSEGRSPLGRRRVHSQRFTREFPRRSPNPTHRFRYRPQIVYVCHLVDTPEHYQGDCRHRSTDQASSSRQRVDSASHKDQSSTDKGEVRERPIDKGNCRTAWVEARKGAVPYGHSNGAPFFGHPGRR